METAADSSRREGGEGEKDGMGRNGGDSFHQRKTLRSVDKMGNRAKVKVN